MKSVSGAAISLGYSIRIYFVPHIHLETTADLIENDEIPELLERLRDALAGVPTIPTESLKAYHTLRNQWTVGAGHAPGFAHCTVAIMEGRELDLQSQIADTVFAVLTEGFARSTEAGDAVVTLEVREIRKATYRRHSPVNAL